MIETVVGYVVLACVAGGALLKLYAEYQATKRALSHMTNATEAAEVLNKTAKDVKNIMLATEINMDPRAKAAFLKSVDGSRQLFNKIKGEAEVWIRNREKRR